VRCCFNSAFSSGGIGNILFSLISFFPFYPRFYVLLYPGCTLIRGDDSQKSPNQNGKTFKEPLRNFQIINATKGEAKVTITSITNPLKLQGIVNVATSKDSSYVVEQIRFDSSDQIQIQVTPR
jgi:hypothetical protein